MNSEASIEIDRPIDEVFEFTTTKVAEWSQIVVEDVLIEKKPGGVGTTFRTVTADRGQRMVFEGIVAHHDPPKRHTVFMKGQKFDMEVDYLFEDLGGSTRVTQRTAVTAKGFMKILFALLGKLMAKASCHAALKELTHLKSVLEAQAPA
jgi:hypothetical protein